MSTPYVALGDSFSAGIGSDTAGTQCRREGGYPVGLARRLRLALTYQACSAATIHDVLAWQVAPVDTETRLVTLTIGGNDAGFADVLIACASPAWLADGEAVVRDNLDRARAELPPLLARLLRELRRRAPHARILLGGYPHLFAGIDCEPLTFFSAEEMQAISAATDEIDALLAAAVDAGDGGMAYVDVRGTFIGHAVCTEDPWVHGLSWPVDTSYHPNDEGHHAYVPVMAAVSDVPQPSEAARRSVTMHEGPRRRGSGRRFRLPDLQSAESLAGAARFGLDPAEVATLAQRIPRGQRALAPSAAAPDESALARLHELDRLVRARRRREPSDRPAGNAPTPTPAGPVSAPSGGRGLDDAACGPEGCPHEEEGARMTGSTEGSGERPARRVAIIGAGPSGLFAAQALAAQDRVPVEIDIYDRLPTPFGLLRYGVAPDHDSIRSVADTLANVFSHAEVRFCGMVEYGQGLTRHEALQAYDAVVYAAGAAEDLRLHVPGEMALGSTSAREFVAWYGGHPDARPFRLGGVTGAATIGVGNVAVDVARVLAKPAAALEWTDMPEPVLAELHASTVRDVYVVGRRGPQHAAFTTKELRDLCSVEGVQVAVSPGAFDDIDEAALDRRTRANVSVLQAAAERVVDRPRVRLHFLFWSRPAEVLTVQNGEREKVTGLVLEGTRLQGTRLIGTGELTRIDVQLVLRAIGYRSSPLTDVPFDAEHGVIPNESGRVVTDQGRPCPQEYAVGWIKRGPIGVIGTNKSDAAETVAHLVDDLAAMPPRPHLLDAHALMRARGFTPTTLEDWHRIDAAERERGSTLGRERTKVAAWEELIELATKRGDALA